LKNINLHQLIAALVVLIFAGVNAYIFSDFFSSYNARLVTQRGDSYKLKLEFARTASEKQKGLMHRRRLEVGRGMLFIYDKPLIPSFWMKNTLIPLDMMFIGEDLVIKYIEEKVPPCISDFCPSYSPPMSVQYVLEVPGGYSYLFKIRAGDTLELTEPIPN
jgi:uncharacterized membrane protein (UPF0127 family)